MSRSLTGYKSLNAKKKKGQSEAQSKYVSKNAVSLQRGKSGKLGKVN
jgi:hypothetical protein